MKAISALAIAILATAMIRAGEAESTAKFSESSSRELIGLHEALLSPALEGVRGIPVADLVWKVDAFEIRIKSGAVFLEPAVAGSPVGAFFEGDATLHFTPIADEQRRKLTFWFGRPSLDEEPITHAYFFSPGGTDLLARLGASGAPSVPFEAAAAYAEAKQAFRERGLAAVETFLDRDGRSKGSAFAVLTAPGIRVGQSKSALLMVCYDPTREEESAIEASGHVAIASKAPWKNRFRTLVAQQSASPRFQPQAEDVHYTIDLTLGAGMDSAVQTTTIVLRPAPGVRVLRFALTPWLQVESVRLGEEHAVPFLQFKRDMFGNDLDASLLIDLGGVTGSSVPIEVVVHSSGALFEHLGDLAYLVDEDDWYPRVADAASATYQLRVSLPSKRVAVAPGRLVEETDDGEHHHYVYRTTRAQKSSSLYIGRFESKVGEADGTKVEVYVGREEKNLAFAAVEIQNILKVFNRLFLPLDLETLRVVATPTSHGRGFDGLLLLSRRAGFTGADSEADLFRAHEVAHEWWGNLVQPERWRDRWLSESFAEYAGMEYYRARFENPKKTRETIYNKWVMPLQRSPASSTPNLRGDLRGSSVQELWSILDAQGNVYTKGPMVLQMLRYLSSVKTGGDEAFWNVQRTFLREFSGKRVSTEDFIAVSQRVLDTDLRWFFSQWLLRSEIPKVRWTHRVEPKDGKWLLTVQAEQVDTEFVLLIPIYAHFAGGKLGVYPFAMRGRSDKKQVLLPMEPEEVTLNDNWEALIEVVH